MSDIVELTEIKTNPDTATTEYEKIIIDLLNVTCFYEELWREKWYSEAEKITQIYIGEHNMIVKEKIETLLNIIIKNGKLFEWVEFEVNNGARFFVRRKNIVKISERNGRTFLQCDNWCSIQIDETIEQAKNKLED